MTNEAYQRATEIKNNIQTCKEIISDFQKMKKFEEATSYELNSLSKIIGSANYIELMDWLIHNVQDSQKGLEEEFAKL